MTNYGNFVIMYICSNNFPVLMAEQVSTWVSRLYSYEVSCPTLKVILEESCQGPMAYDELEIFLHK